MDRRVARTSKRPACPGRAGWRASRPRAWKTGGRYVVFDAHRSDDDEPYVFVTEDFGKTWKSLRGKLPSGSTRVLREDVS